MDTDPADLLSASFDLSRVDPAADFERRFPDRRTDRVRAGDRQGGDLEDGQEAVARGVDLAPGEPAELTAHAAVVLVEELSPFAVAEPGRALGGADDVGEEEGCERSRCRRHSRPRSGRGAEDRRRVSAHVRAATGNLLGGERSVNHEAEGAGRVGADSVVRAGLELSELG